LYLNYIKSYELGDTVSSTKIAKALGLGEVQVRKDLSIVCSDGKPKIGYKREVLVSAIEEALGVNEVTRVAVIGAGKLGKALMGFDGFHEYGIDIAAGFDVDPGKTGIQPDGKLIYLMDELKAFCRIKDVHIGVLTVPPHAAQAACDKMMDAGIDVIWSFSPVDLEIREGVMLRKENLALGLAHLVVSSEKRSSRSGMD